MLLPGRFNRRIESDSPSIRFLFVRIGDVSFQIHDEYDDREHGTEFMQYEQYN